MAKPLIYCIFAAAIGAVAAHAIQDYVAGEGGAPNPAVTAAVASVLGFLGFQRGRLAPAGGS